MNTDFHMDFIRRCFERITRSLFYNSFRSDVTERRTMSFYLLRVYSLLTCVVTGSIVRPFSEGHAKICVPRVRTF
jgi:hypothetical protein